MPPDNNQPSAQNNFSTPPVVPPNMPIAPLPPVVPTQSRSSLIILVVILVLAVIAGLWYWQTQSTEEVIPEPAPIETNTEPVVETDPTANWQTYRNEEYAYELKYQPTFSKTEPNLATLDFDGLETSSLLALSYPAADLLGTNLSAVSLIVGAKQVTENECYGMLYGNPVSAFVSSQSPDQFWNGQVVTLGDLSFRVNRASEGAAGSTYNTWRYSTMKNGQCYQLSLVARSFNHVLDYNYNNPNEPIVSYSPEQILPVFQQVVSTFKFTEQ